MLKSFLLFVSFALWMTFWNCAEAATKKVTLVIENASVTPIDIRYEIYRKDSVGDKVYYATEDVNQLNPHAKYSVTIPSVGTDYTPFAEIAKVSMGNKTVGRPGCSKAISKSNNLLIQVFFADTILPAVTCVYID
jgi:hypothetical protein